MRIVGLKLRNYRIFRELDWAFGEEDLFVLIGKNGGGKSAVLNALSIGLQVIVDRLTTKGHMKTYSTNLELSDITVGAEDCVVEVTFAVRIHEPFTIGASIGRNSNQVKYTVTSWEAMTWFQKHLLDDHIGSLPVFIDFGVDRTYGQDKKKPRSRNPYHRLLYAYQNTFYNRQPPFQSFRDWFIAEDTVEIQQKVSLGKLTYTSESLSVFRSAIALFFNNMESEVFGPLEVVRENNSIEDRFSDTSSGLHEYLVVSKGGESIRLDNLSSGEKGILLLAIEIARRLYLANRDEDALTGKGIVLIDEIELHLHPAWQRGILPALRKTFPNVQFIVTTHSPQTLSTLTREQIIIVDNGQLHTADTDPLGRDTNGILEELMDVDKRPKEIDDLIDEILGLLYADHPDFVQAQEKVARLKTMVAPTDPILTRIEALTRRRKALA